MSDFDEASASASHKCSVCTTNIQTKDTVSVCQFCRWAICGKCYTLRGNRLFHFDCPGSVSCRYSYLTKKSFH
jgi:hypothetical protein